MGGKDSSRRERSSGARLGGEGAARKIRKSTEIDGKSGSKSDVVGGIGVYREHLSARIERRVVFSNKCRCSICRDEIDTGRRCETIADRTSAPAASNTQPVLSSDDVEELRLPGNRDLLARTNGEIVKRRCSRDSAPEKFNVAVVRTALDGGSGIEMRERMSVSNLEYSKA